MVVSLSSSTKIESFKYFKLHNTMNCTRMSVEEEKMNLTLRQIINNHPLLKWVNSSKVGKQFQNSAFARNIEAANNIVVKNISESIVDEEGIVLGILFGIKDVLNSSKQYSRHSYITNGVEASRPDLNGTINPQTYALAIYEQRCGRSFQTILDKYGVPNKQVA